jgi:hypothetical protein
VFGLMLMGVIGVGQAMGQVGSFTKAGAAAAMIFAVAERTPRIPTEVCFSLHLPGSADAEVSHRAVRRWRK